MLLFVDSLEAFGLGGTTRDLTKIRFALSKFNLDVENIIKTTVTDLYTGIFHAGRYVAIFQFDKEFTKGQLAFINYETNLDSHFDIFADTLTPKTVAGFFKMQQIIKSKDAVQLNLVELTNEPIFFNPISEN